MMAPPEPAQGPRRARRRSAPRGLSAAARLAVVLVVLGLLACACLFTATRILAVRVPEPGVPAAPRLNPLEAFYLSTYLGLRADDLGARGAAQAEPVLFEVAPGSSAATIADQLARRGLIADAELFRNYVRYTGLDSQLEAGRFRLSAAMTLVEIAEALTEALSPDVVVQVIEGWRMEQIAEAIDAAEGLAFTGEDFLAVVGAGVLQAEDPPAFDFLASAPPGASLEGFLFPDTYRVAPEATAVEFRDMMLKRFGERVTPQMRDEALAKRYNLYEVVALAAIVEREAVIPTERPMIAAVYLNRLARGMTLDADPTVQYAKSAQTPGEWWPDLTRADYTDVISPYNTYLNPGLPPGPIANPSLSSIQAVIYPEAVDYLYFRACDDTGRHVFSMTFDEHLAACD